MFPVIVSDWHTVAEPPNLTAECLETAEGAPGRGRNEPNDHTFYRDPAGLWHLWACVRLTRAGRILCHWTSPSLAASNWTRSSDIIRCDKSAGESQVEWRGQEFIQSPFVVTHAGKFWMFYGGYDTGAGPDGRPTTDYNLQEKQLCLMLSPDGRAWTRHRDALGFSRVFVGPGAVRDPMIGFFNGKWHAYYAGHHGQDRNRAGIYARSSADLIHWSDWRLVNHDPRPLANGKPCIHESPFVAERGGRFHLFRNPGIHPGTLVFASGDPLDFGVGAAACDAHYATNLPEVIAPEIVVDADGREWISRINSPEGYRIQLARLEWKESLP